MKAKTSFKIVIGLALILLSVPADAAAREEFGREHLDRLLAPIALYPDPLLSQILMATTYPLEVMEADRWLEENPGLTGTAFDEALREKPWDVSVKSLTRYPEVLAEMSENLSETTALGDAFLEHQIEVMDAIQELRAKARVEGHLASSDKQTVIVDGEIIAIAPVRQDFLYIPVYDPCRIYGLWWYPECSPPWFHYPGLSIGKGLSFGPPLYTDPPGYWSGFQWIRHHLIYNPDKTVFFYRSRIIGGRNKNEVWRHNPFHRKSVRYYGSEAVRRYDPFYRPGVDGRRYYPDRYGPVPLPGGDSRRYYPFDRYGTLPLPDDDDRRFPHRRYGPLPRPDDDEDREFHPRRYGPLPRPETFDRRRPHRRYETIPRPERYDRRFGEDRFRRFTRFGIGSQPDFRKISIGRDIFNLPRKRAADLIRPPSAIPNLHQKRAEALIRLPRAIPNLHQKRAEALIRPPGAFQRKIAGVYSGGFRTNFGSKDFGVYSSNNTFAKFGHNFGIKGDFIKNRRSANFSSAIGKHRSAFGGRTSFGIQGGVDRRKK